MSGDGGDQRARMAKAAEHLRCIAADVREAGDLPLILMTENGVTRPHMTLSDELWTIAYNLDADVALHGAAREPALPNDSVEVARITIIKTFDADGGFSVVANYGTGLTLLDALGMLAFAQSTTPATYAEGDA